MISILSHDLTLFTVVQRAAASLAATHPTAPPPPIAIGTSATELRAVLPLSPLVIVDGAVLSAATVRDLQAHVAPNTQWAVVLSPTAAAHHLAPALLALGSCAPTALVLDRTQAADPARWGPYLTTSFANAVVTRAADAFRTQLVHHPEPTLLTEVFRVTPRAGSVQQLPPLLQQDYRVAVGSLRTLARRLEELQAPPPNTLLGAFRIVHYRQFVEEAWGQESIARALSFPNAAALRRSFQQRAGVALRTLRETPAERVLAWGVEQLQCAPTLPLRERVLTLQGAA